MKRLLSVGLLLCFSFLGLNSVKAADSTTAATTDAAATATAATATTTTDWDSAAALARVNAIGQKLMSASKLPDGITFKVSDDESINAYANLNKEVYVYKGLLQYVNDDNELAAVISHELGHIINGHCAKQTVADTALSAITNKISSNGGTVASLGASTAQQLASSKISRTDEFEADLTGADLLVNAGYNPLAMVSVLNKICGNYFDLLETHPSGEKRLLNIYDYVDYNYPQYTKTGYDSDSYQKAMAVIQAHVSDRTSTTKKVNQFNKDQEKLKAAKVKREQKMAKSGSNPWEMSANVLQMFSK